MLFTADLSLQARATMLADVRRLTLNGGDGDHCSLGGGPGLYKRAQNSLTLSASQVKMQQH